MPEEKLKFEELMKRLNEDRYLSSVDIYTGIKDDVPSFIGFPMHFNYAPVISVRIPHDNCYSLEVKGRESPDEDVVRLAARVGSYQLAFMIVGQLSKKKSFIDDKPVRIKIDDLPVDEARKIFILYRQEFQRIQEEHKGYMYL